MLPLLAIFPLLTFAKARRQTTLSSRCVGTISSLNDVDSAVKCATVNINGFIVPAGQTFSLNLLPGSTVNVLGDIVFGNQSWTGPLFEVQGEGITFNGNSQLWDGGGSYYWDGLGGAGGVTKPSPMMSIRMSGTLFDVHAVNSPERCFSIDNVGPLTVSGVVVDDSQGNYPNAKSNGEPAGRNTDGFGVTGNDVTIQKSVVINQDDCLAVNKGQNITFHDNYCESGHGISIGSITSNVDVQDVTIQGNTVVNSQQAFRIKTHRDATNSKVSRVVYSDNTATNCTSYGIIITQSYPQVLGDPGTGVIISDINFFPGTTKIHMAGEGEALAINCGAGSCAGTWDWSGLKTGTGRIGKLDNCPELTGYAM